MLFKANVTASETYNTALEQHLRDTLGVRFAERPGSSDPGKRPVREIVGVDLRLNQRWSTRRAHIQVRQEELAIAFQHDHGRPPTPIEALHLAQEATLETRDAKYEPRSLAEQRATWQAEAEQVLGGRDAVTAMVGKALTPTAGTRVPVDAESDEISSSARHSHLNDPLAHPDQVDCGEPFPVDAANRGQAPGIGPLPWLPGVPEVLHDHPVWGEYLAKRAGLIADLAAHVRGAATELIAPPVWATPGSRPSVALVGEVEVWRAANGIDPNDHRATGARQLPTASAHWQHLLDRRLADCSDDLSRLDVRAHQAASRDRRHEDQQRMPQPPATRPNSPPRAGL